MFWCRGLRGVRTIGEVGRREEGGVDRSQSTFTRSWDIHVVVRTYERGADPSIRKPPKSGCNLWPSENSYNKGMGPKRPLPDTIGRLLNEPVHGNPLRTQLVNGYSQHEVGTNFV